MFMNPFGALPYGNNPWSQSSVISTGNLWGDDNTVWNLSDPSGVVQNLPQTQALFGRQNSYGAMGPGATNNAGFYSSLLQSQAQQTALLASMNGGNSGTGLTDIMKMMMFMKTMDEMSKGSSSGSRERNSDTNDLKQFAGINPGQQGNAVLKYGSFDEFSKNNYKENMTVDEALTSLGSDSKNLSDTDKKKILEFLGKDNSSASLSQDEYKRLMGKFGFSSDKSEIKRSDMHFDGSRTVEEPQGSSSSSSSSSGSSSSSSSTPARRASSGGGSAASRPSKPAASKPATPNATLDKAIDGVRIADDKVKDLWGELNEAKKDAAANKNEATANKVKEIEGRLRDAENASIAAKNNEVKVRYETRENDRKKVSDEISEITKKLSDSKTPEKDKTALRQRRDTLTSQADKLRAGRDSAKSALDASEQAAKARENADKFKATKQDGKTAQEKAAFREILGQTEVAANSAAAAAQEAYKASTTDELSDKASKAREKARAALAESQKAQNKLGKAEEKTLADQNWDRAKIASPYAP